MQTKKQSFIESLTNTLVGFLFSFASTFLIFPLMGMQGSVGKNFVITIFFTVVSVLRGYVIRRYFNKKQSICKTLKVEVDREKLNEILKRYEMINKSKRS
jgi:hypothetical protein